MDKYNISVWETFPRTELISLDGVKRVETEDKKPIYFYFQYPILESSEITAYTQNSSGTKQYSDVNDTWLYNRARMKQILNSSESGELLLACSNLTELSSLNAQTPVEGVNTPQKSVGYKLVLTNEKLSSFLSNYETPYQVKRNATIYLDGVRYKYNGYNFSLYYKAITDGYTYTAIKVYDTHYDSEDKKVKTIDLSRVTSGLIWAITLSLINDQGKKLTKLIAIYNIKNGVELAQAYINPNTVSSNRLKWLKSGSYSYAPYGLNLIDLPSNANEIFENNNQLLFNQQEYELKTKTLKFGAGSRISRLENGVRVYYTIIDIIDARDDSDGTFTLKIVGIKDGESEIQRITYSSLGEFTGVYEFFDEKRKFIIGCNDMRALSRGREPSLKVNINGTKTFTFKMYYYYIDDETGEEVKNPYIDQIFNESRIKVQWYGEWYDFIVKNIVEDTSSYSITYTCKDSFIYELSKNGYSLEFQDDLMNNQGDIFELSKEVVKTTDWQVIDDEATSDPKSDHIYQYLEEPLCQLSKFKTGKIDIFDENGNRNYVSTSQVAIFYSQFGKTSDIQCLYPYSEEAAKKDRDGLVIKNKEIQQYYIDSLSSSVAKALVINLPWRGRRKITSIKTIYDKVVKKNVMLYRMNDEHGEYTIHGWTETKFKNPASVQNLFANYKDFKTIKGWFVQNDNNYNIQYDPDLSFITASVASGDEGRFLNLMETLRLSGTLIIGEVSGQTYDINSYIYKRGANGFTGEYIFIGSSMNISSGAIYINLQDTSTGSITTETSLTSYYGFKQNTKSYIPIPNGQIVYNKGLYENAKYLDEGLQENQCYVLKYKLQYYNTTQQKWVNSYERGIALQIASNFSEPTEILNYNSHQSKNGYCYDFYIGTKSITQEEIVSNNMTFMLYGTNTSDYRISEIEFFPLYKTSKNGEEVILEPGNIETDTIYQTFYYFYNVDNNKLALTREEIRFIYSAPVGTDYLYSDYNNLMTGLKLTPIYTSNKVTSISQKESNRYNIIQALCEKFQCWAKFYIRHDPITGRTLTPLDLESEDETPIKYIIFKEDLTKHKGLTFTDGLDLISINKTLQSENIATQLYVKPNITDAVDGGIVTIATSDLNPTKDTYILNFDFFIENGMIQLEDLIQDQSNFYSYIASINTEYDELQKDYRKLKAELDSTLALEQVYKNYAPEVEDALNENKNDIVFLVNGMRDAENAVISCDNYYTALNYIFTKNFKGQNQTHLIPSKVCTLFIANLTLGKQAKEGRDKLTEIQSKLQVLRSRIAPTEYRLNELLTLRQVAQKNFVQKYGQFIFEGVWESSDYVDADKYYYDAVNVSSTSARPTISYTFNVMRLGALEEYNTRQFEVGDTGYVQDSKLLGYQADGITPIKEKVIISEITYFFDESNKDKITVQNYRTQFEDLMSRIVAQVQTPKYAPAAYDTTVRATVITPNLPTYKV